MPDLFVEVATKLARGRVKSHWRRGIVVGDVLRRFVAHTLAQQFSIRMSPRHHLPERDVPGFGRHGQWGQAHSFHPPVL